MKKTLAYQVRLRRPPSLSPLRRSQFLMAVSTSASVDGAAGLAITAPAHTNKKKQKLG